MNLLLASPRNISEKKQVWTNSKRNVMIAERCQVDPYA
jgi:hypothetical protein